MPSTERKDIKRSSTPHSSRIVRRSFSMQETDAQLIELLRVRYATQGLLVNQSEVVRIGLRVLADMNDGDLKKTGREPEETGGDQPRKKTVSLADRNLLAPAPVLRQALALCHTDIYSPLRCTPR